MTRQSVHESHAVHGHGSVPRSAAVRAAPGRRSALHVARAALRAGAPDTARLRAKVVLTEALGSEIVAHFLVDAPTVVTEDTRLLEQEAGAGEVATLVQGTEFVASFAPRSRVRPGDTVEVVVDTERLHFFDPATGLAIRD